MDDAQKMQEDHNDETPENVQNESELVQNQNSPENLQEETHPPESSDSELEQENLSEEVDQKEAEPVVVIEDKEVTESSNEPETESEPMAEVTQTNKEKPTEEIGTDESVTPDDAVENNEGVEEPKEEKEREEEKFQIDLSEASVDEVMSALQDIRNEEDGRKLDVVLKEAKPRFDELYEVEKNEALQKFVSEGNEADDFKYQGNESDKNFFALYNVLRARRNKFFKDLENTKEVNLKKKEEILDLLREIVDGEESESSFNKVRDLQNGWKNVGPVPGAHNKTLWANYNALLDRFYDNRSIYFELKDLDRKKNLEQKTELCEKAEALANLEDIKEAVMQLNDLHEEYKHIGPVPKDDQEPLWQRFKAASDEVYSKRKVFFDGLKVQFEKNLVIKEELITELSPFLTFDSEKISEWNKKTKEILEVQKKWEAVGGIPREKAKAVNKAFWNTFKSFFAKKNKFFKSLESQRDDNLIKKEELIKQAEELMNSSDFVSTADKLKHLQEKWKEIGPVPEKARNETYQKFKEACDHFFDRRREQGKEQNKGFEENLKLKEQVCNQIITIAADEEMDLDQVYDLVDNYASIGFVPKNTIRKIQKKFDEAISKVLESGVLSEYDAQDLTNHIRTSRLRNSPGGERKLHRKEQSIRRKMSSIENDINTYKTNIEFFAKSAAADKVKAEFEQKIEDSQKELADLKKQLQSLNQ